jgi:hypothetical protein
VRQQRVHASDMVGQAQRADAIARGELWYLAIEEEARAIEARDEQQRGTTPDNGQ